MLSTHTVYTVWCRHSAQLPGQQSAAVSRYLTVGKSPLLSQVSSAEPLWQHHDIIPPAEYATADRSITEMVASLNEACHQSSDPLTAPNLVVTSRSSTEGQPWFEIDCTVFTEVLELRGPTHLADVFHVSARTIRRRAIDNRLVEPGEPVYTDTPQLNGSTSRTYTSTTVKR
jgi:hypothetical protein